MASGRPNIKDWAGLLAACTGRTADQILSSGLNPMDFSRTPLEVRFLDGSTATFRNALYVVDESRAQAAVFTHHCGDWEMSTWCLSLRQGDDAYEGLHDRHVEIVINSAAQGRAEIAEARRWFDRRPEEERGNILQVLARCIHQAHPIPEESEKAIKSSGLKPTYTPCVQLSRFPPIEAAGRICQLRGSEHSKAFCLLLHLFKHADTRRRETRCKDGCYHHWHNLDTDPEYQGVEVPGWP